MAGYLSYVSAANWFQQQPLNFAALNFCSPASHILQPSLFTYEALENNRNADNPSNGYPAKRLRYERFEDSYLPASWHKIQTRKQKGAPVSRAKPLNLYIQWNPPILLTLRIIRMCGRLRSVRYVAIFGDFRHVLYTTFTWWIFHLEMSWLSGCYVTCKLFPKIFCGKHISIISTCGKFETHVSYSTMTFSDP